MGVITTFYFLFIKLLSRAITTLVPAVTIYNSCFLYKSAKVVRRFYGDLYSSKVVAEHRERAPIANVGSEEIPDITLDKVHLALRQLKN